MIPLLLIALAALVIGVIFTPLLLAGVPAEYRHLMVVLWAIFFTGAGMLPISCAVCRRLYDAGRSRIWALMQWLCMVLTAAVVVDVNYPIVARSLEEFALINQRYDEQRCEAHLKYHDDRRLYEVMKDCITANEKQEARLMVERVCRQRREAVANEVQIQYILLLLSAGSWAGILLLGFLRSRESAAGGHRLRAISFVLLLVAGAMVLTMLNRVYRSYQEIEITYENNAANASKDFGPFLDQQEAADDYNACLAAADRVRTESKKAVWTREYREYGILNLVCLLLCVGGSIIIYTQRFSPTNSDKPKLNS